MPNILIVCTANICRSPVVMALLDNNLHKTEGEDWNVSSAGTWAQPGDGASDYSVLLMAEQGLDISDHSSRPIDQEMLANSDLVLCLETGHSEALRAEFPDQAEKIYTLSEISGPAYSVRDPYGGTREAYEQMVREVTKLIEDGLPRIVQLARANAAMRQGD